MAVASPSAAPRVLALRALGLGDFLTGVPALRALRRAMPEHRLALAAPAVLAPLAELCDAVDDVLPTSGPVPIDWTGDPPEVAVNVHGRGPQSHRQLLALRPRRLVAFAHPELPDVAGPRWDPTEHEVRRWCRLVTGAGFPADPEDLRLRRPDESSAVPGSVVVHPGSAFAARRWPADRFADVAGELHRRGHRVVLTGSSDEAASARRVAVQAGLPEADVLAGRTDLASLAAVVAEARLVVCGDTGVGHLATAYGTPSVLLFGPTPPEQWGPLDGSECHVVLWRGDPRTPGNPRGNAPDPALLRIGVGEVLNAALHLLDYPARPWVERVGGQRRKG